MAHPAGDLHAQEARIPRFLLEWKMPGAGKLKSEELRGAAQTSHGVLQRMQQDGKNVQWVESCVTDDAIHCIYIAPDEAAIREHAQSAGFPADGVHQIRTVISPATAGERWRTK